MTVPWSGAPQGWQCPICGIVWGPNYPGPCTHPGFTKWDRTETKDATGCSHEYVGEDTTAGAVCWRCGHTRPL